MARKTGSSCAQHSMDAAPGLRLVIDLQCLFRSALCLVANGTSPSALTPSARAQGLLRPRHSSPSFHTHAWIGISSASAPGIPVHWDFKWIPERPPIARCAAQWPVAKTRWLVLQPAPVGSTNEPAEHFATWCVAWLRPGDMRFPFSAEWMTNAGKNHPQADAQRCLDLTGKLSLLEMVEWIRLSE